MQINEYKEYSEQVAQEITDFINQKMKEFKRKTGQNITYIATTIVPASHLSPHPNVLESKGLYHKQNVVSRLNLSTTLSSGAFDVERHWKQDESL